jgi:NAD dependent epimerase/dehydratase
MLQPSMTLEDRRRGADATDDVRSTDLEGSDAHGTRGRVPLTGWTGKRVLVTGADGFIGSHLVESLLDSGASVKALSLYNSFNHWGWLEAIAGREGLEIVSGDIRDAHFCEALVEGAEVVFHLAALIPIPYSYVAPDSFVDTNVRGTLNMLQAARRARVERFIQTSTSEVYGTARYVPIDEAHPIQPQSPYAATKVAADALAISFHRSFGLPVAIARPFNTYGPRQSARAVIPTIVAQLAHGSCVRLGNLEATRDLNYVEDTCRGLMAIGAAPDATGDTFNIGSDREISVGDLCARIADLMEVRDLRIVQDEARLRPAASEVERLRCDVRKLAAATGYAPTVSLDEGLRRTIDWFRRPENLQGYKAWLYNV